MAAFGFGTDEDQSVVAENRLRARREFSAHPGRYAAIVEADRKQGIGQAPGAWKLQIGILSEKGVPAAFSSRIAHLDEIVRTIFRHFNSTGVQNGNAGDKRCEQVRTLLRGQRYQQPAVAVAVDRALSRFRESTADSLSSAGTQVALAVFLTLTPPPAVPPPP